MDPSTRRLLACLWLLLASPAAARDWQVPPPLGFRDAPPAPAGASRGDLAQTLVVPERPGQSRIAWYEFDWHHYDVPPPGGGPGGVRLYYYQRERAVAERALPVIRGAFIHLTDRFRYSPTKQIPYFLYSSKREFQSTNIFQVSESVLGVTAPGDLKMSLPYFGSQERFREISTHELVHQFTVQKLIDAGGREQLFSLVEILPLWFIEGIAEYYAHGGLDVDTEIFLRDLVWNPDAEKHHEVVSFAEDKLRGYIPTYKQGQARVAFLAETYGEERIQSFLENAPHMGAASPGPSGTRSQRAFAALVRRVLNEDLQQVDTRWKAWLKRRYYREYLAARQDLAQVRLVPDAPDEIEAYAVSPDGSTVLTRQIDREEGRAHLYLLDPRHPQVRAGVAGDSRPGFESFHPIDQSVLAVGEGILAFAAQDGPGDSVYVQTFRRSDPASTRPPVFSLGSRRRIPVVHPAGQRFIEISDLAFSPDARQIAFAAMGEAGQRDVWVVPVEGGAARQVTDDPWDERDVFWGRDGIYCASDATDHGRFNLFRLDPASGARTRLTTAPATDRRPVPQADGSVVFSSDAAGKPDLYLLAGGRTSRLTDFATGLWNPGPSPSGRSYLAQTFHKGRFHLVDVSQTALLAEPALAVAPAPGPALSIPSEPFPADLPPYRPYRLSNWRVEGGFLAAAAAPGAYGGRASALFADVLRDQLLFVDLAILGRIDYTQALVIYENRSGRRPWVLGASHLVQAQFDRVDPNLSYLQREFAVSGGLRFPLNRYQRFDLELSLGGINRYCLTDEAPLAIGSPIDVCGGFSAPRPPFYDSQAQWERLNGGVNLVVTPAVSYGYDTVRLDPVTGPIAGSAVLLEAGGRWVPARRALSGWARADLAQWFRLVGRANIMFRVAAGSAFAPDQAGRAWGRTWWVSAPDNLRGFYPVPDCLDFDRRPVACLLGSHYWVANAELQFPLQWLLRLFFFDFMEGVAAIDFGGVFNRWSTRRDPVTSEILDPGPWDARTLTAVLGVNVILGPLLLRVHFGHPIDVGGQKTLPMVEGRQWVPNVTLRWFFF